MTSREELVKTLAKDSDIRFLVGCDTEMKSFAKSIMNRHAVRMGRKTALDLTVGNLHVGLSAFLLVMTELGATEDRARRVWGDAVREVVLTGAAS